MKPRLAVAMLLAAMTAMVLLWNPAADVPENISTRRAVQLQVRHPAVNATFDPRVRVNLTDVPVTKSTIAIDGPFRVTPIGDSRILYQGNRFAAATVFLTATGFRFGRVNLPASRIEIVSDKSPAVWVGDHQYRGRIRLHRRQGERFTVVNVLPLEEYIASVVDSEMPAAIPKPARRAQAIVARTYALYQMTSGTRHPIFDLYGSTRSQKYLGYKYRNSKGRLLAGESAAGRLIANETAGIVCTHGGRVFCTYYSAVCGGNTTAGKQVFTDAAPPLRSVPCDWCREAKRYRWSSRLSKKRVRESLRPLFSDRQSFGPIQSVTRMRDTKTSGQAVYLVDDRKRQHRVSATDFRRRLPTGTLHSPHFDVRDEGADLVFDGRGHGHGVGLCQWGARGQGLANRTCVQILAHYYPGSTVVVLESAKR